MVRALDNAAAPTSLPSSKPFPTKSLIDLEKGDPMVFEPFWISMSEKCTVEIKGHEFLSYLSDAKNACWFMLPEFQDAIKRLHRLVGNAEIDNKHIVVGTGATQLFQAALFALSPSDSPNPINVVAASPYYSEYQDEASAVRSGLFKWAGDAHLFDKNEPYIEVVTSPNNPDGTMREPVVRSNAEGKLIHDYAYYWPHYTPITYKADHDIMIFTFSKCTGHAGSRIGWAIVKDETVARKMTRFIQMSSIGVSKDSQFRVAKIVGVICDAYQDIGTPESELFFEYGKRLMKNRWEKLKEAIKQSDLFSVPKYPKAYCNFTHDFSRSYPAFAWLHCKEGKEDCESQLSKLRIVGRDGKRFGDELKYYARVSMLSRDDVFDEFILRLSNINAN